jgi:hypothetical protein
VPDASLEAALAAQDWTDLSQRLTRYTYARLRKSSWETAEDLAQQAITQLLDPAYASWDRERHPDLFDCLGHIANGLVANHVRRQGRRGQHVPLREDDATHDDELAPLPVEESRDRGGAEDDTPPADAVHVADPRTAEDLLSARPLQSRREEQAMAAVRARVGQDALCLGLLDRIQNRKEGRAAADAMALGVLVHDVYAAKRRLLHHARQVARDLAEGES